MEPALYISTALRGGWCVYIVFCIELYKVQKSAFSLTNPEVCFYQKMRLFEE